MTPSAECFLILRATDLRSVNDAYITLIGIGDTLQKSIDLAKADYMSRLSLISALYQEKVDTLEIFLLIDHYYETTDIGIDTWYIIHKIPINTKLPTTSRLQLDKHAIITKIKKL